MSGGGGHTVQDWLENTPQQQPDEDFLQTRKLTDQFLSDLSLKIPRHWEKLAAELEVDPYYVDKLLMTVTFDVCSCVNELLLMWTETTPDHIDLLELLTALKHVHRNDLVESVMEKFPGVTQLQNVTHDLQKLFMDLAQKISKEWYQLGLQLNIKSEELDSLKTRPPPRDYNPALEMLTEWNKDFKRTNRLNELKDCLEMCRRNDVVRWIEEKNHAEIFVQDHAVCHELRNMQISHTGGPGGRSQHNTQQQPASVSQASKKPPVVQHHDRTTNATNPTRNRLAIDEVDNEEQESLGRSPTENADESESGIGGSQQTEPKQLCESVSDVSDKIEDPTKGQLWQAPGALLTGRLTLDPVHSGGTVSSYAASKTSV